MTALQRAQILRWRLQQQFRIDLYSPVAESSFERQLADAIDAAEREGFRRGQEEARNAPSPQRQRSGIIARRQ